MLHEWQYVFRLKLESYFLRNLFHVAKLAAVQVHELISIPEEK